MTKRNVSDTLQCVVCGKTVKRSKKEGNIGHFCSACRQRYRHWQFKKKAVEYKGGKCAICGYNKSIDALDFHHVDPDIKDFNVSDAYGKAWSTVQAELDKCILLCANCHRELHGSEKYYSEYAQCEKWITRLTTEEKDKRRTAAEEIKNLKEKLAIEKDKKNADRIQLIENSGIDFSKHGWSQQLAPLIHLRSKSIVKWMRRHMPEFYQKYCFKNKLTITEKDINDMINLYQNGKNIEQVAVCLSLDPGRVSNCLKEQGFDLKQRSQRKVNMVDPRTGEIIKSFESITSAAIYCEKYIIKSNITKHRTIVNKISLCINNGRQKTAYGFKWSTVES